MEEILGHYEEESRFCGTCSYTVEILVGDEVKAVEAVGKIFLEEVKVRLAQLYKLLLYNPYELLCDPMYYRLWPRKTNSGAQNRRNCSIR
jgi:hypothetical protein